NPEMANAYEVPKYFQGDLFETLSEKRPPHRWMIIGPARSGASWHVDPFGTSAWNTLLTGRKRWALYPPHVFPPGMTISRTGMNGHQSLFNEGVLDDTKDSTTSLLWYLEVYPQLEPGALPLEIVQEAGQTIFLPSGWWHMVLNIEDTIAITQNFANIHNLEHVCETLMSERHKQQASLLLWELFSESVTTAYPYLDPFISHKVSQLLDTTDDPIILEEGFSSKIDFVESFRDLNFWKPRVARALERCGIDQNVEIDVITRGQNPVFQISTFIIKFYSHLHNGIETFTTEINAYSHIREHISNEFTECFPKLLGTGYLFDESNERKYRWPFSIIEAVAKGGSSLSEITSGVESYTTFDDKLDSDDESGIISWNEVIDFTVKILYGILPSVPSVVHLNSHSFLKFLSQRLEKAPSTHAEWLIFPPRLNSQISSYLPNSLLELYNPDLDGTAGFLHGDFNAENILGLIMPDDPNDLDLDEFKSGHWKATSIIDFGDAHLYGGDPLFELVLVFISVFGCSKTLLRRFLEKYNHEGDLKISTRMFARRAMWYTLLLGFEGATKHMLKSLPGIRELGSWFEVESYAWNFDSVTLGNNLTL
ncbi:1734_t:CDS:10, partial [Acaulospora morrowiae]